MKKAVITGLLAALLCPGLAGNAEPVIKTDPESGLQTAPGLETVKANCTACHSARLITAQRGDRQHWLKLIRWMQDTQGLWKLETETEDVILSYLASQYPPVWSGRRANLPAEALPPIHGSRTRQHQPAIN